MSAVALKQTMKLLVVEDSPDLQLLLQHLFNSEGYEVESAFNGEEALRLLQSQQNLPNLILLDLMMPVMDGFEFREKQQNDPRLAHIPVVLMTAHGDEMTSQARIRPKEFIRKPADMDALLESVRKYAV